MSALVVLCLGLVVVVIAFAIVYDDRNKWGF